MHTEAVNARVFDMTPVTENPQLHVTVHHVTRVLQEGRGATGKREKKQNRNRTIKREVHKKRDDK